MKYDSVTATLRMFSLLLVLVLALPGVLAATLTVNGGGGNFTTIQAAIDAASPGDMINVEAGTYAESVIVDKLVTITGTGAGSIIIGSPAVTISADGVVIDGFTLTTPVILQNSPAVKINSGLSDVTISNNIITNVWRGIEATWQTNPTISDNVFDTINNGIGEDQLYGGIGIVLNGGVDGATVTGNEFSAVDWRNINFEGSGVNNYVANNVINGGNFGVIVLGRADWLAAPLGDVAGLPVAYQTFTIENNVFDVKKTAIDVDSSDGNPSGVVTGLDNVVIRNNSGTADETAILVVVAKDSEISDNTFSTSGVGESVMTVIYGEGLTINNNEFTAVPGSTGFVGEGLTDVSFNGGTYSGGDVGILFMDGLDARINGMMVLLGIDHFDFNNVDITGVILDGNAVGVQFNGTDGGDANTSSITESSLLNNDVDLINGVDAADKQIIATPNWWGTAVESTIQTMALGTVDYDPYYVDSSMTTLSSDDVTTYYVDDDYTDGNAGGHIFGYDAYATIQEAIDHSNGGDTINVADGTYTEDLLLNKQVTINGAGVVTTTITGTHTVSASNVAVSGFTFDMAGSGTTFTVDTSAAAVNGLTLQSNTFDLSTSPSVGVALTDGTNGVGDITMNGNLFIGPVDKVCNPWKIGGSFGSAVSVNVNGLEFSNNEVDSCSIPVNLQDANITDVLVHLNVFTNTDGVLYIWGHAPASGVLSDFVFTNNTVDNTNSYGVAIGGPVLGSPGYTDANFGTNVRINNNLLEAMSSYGLAAVYLNATNYTLDATYNWWGSADGPSGAGPGTGSEVSENVDFTPWLPAASTAPFATLSIDPSYPINGSYVFICEANGYEASTYDWNFGDGSGLIDVSNGNVQHQYSTNGDYTVVCMATGAITEQATLGITVTTVPDVVPSLSPVTVAVKSPYPKQNHYVFTCSVDGYVPDSYDWDFGDGEKLYDIANADVYHIYNPFEGDTVVSCGATKDGVTSYGFVNITVDQPARVELVVTDNDPSYTLSCDATGFTAETYDWNVYHLVSGEILVRTFDISNQSITVEMETNGPYWASCSATGGGTTVIDGERLEVNNAVTEAPPGDELSPIELEVVFDANTTTLIVPEGANTDIRITVPSSVTSSQIDLTQTLLSVTNETKAFLPVTATFDSTTSAGQVIVRVPAGITITGPIDWDGVLHLPSLTAAPPDLGDVTISLAIHIGSDEFLVFDKAVRIQFVGHAGENVAWVNGDVVNKITTTCSADDQGIMDDPGLGGLAEGEECSIDVGGDLVVWTKHFTDFVTYVENEPVDEPVATTSRRGGGGGGGGGGGWFTNLVSSGGSDSEDDSDVAEETHPDEPAQSTSQELVQDALVEGAVEETQTEFAESGVTGLATGKGAGVRTSVWWLATLLGLIVVAVAFVSIRNRRR